MATIPFDSYLRRANLMSNRTYFEQSDWRRREWLALPPAERARLAAEQAAALAAEEPGYNEVDTQPLAVPLPPAEKAAPDVPCVPFDGLDGLEV